MKGFRYIWRGILLIFALSACRGPIPTQVEDTATVPALVMATRTETPMLTFTATTGVATALIATPTKAEPTETKTPVSQSMHTLTPAPAPSIILISPNGREEWVEGATVDIVWRAQGVE